MTRVVFVRHGQSTWNQENRFTGWTDVELSERGIGEALRAGKWLREAGFRFDLSYTSFLKRAIKTLWLILEEMDQMYVPVDTDWRMNERHYGALQGLNKKETMAKHGEAQVHQWRRGYAIQPPPLNEDDPLHPQQDPRYAGIDVPGTESLADTLQRVIPYWRDKILPQLQADKRLIIAAHGNSLRALVKHLDEISDDDIMSLNIPTGIPLVYELDKSFKPLRHYYLADEKTLDSAVKEVANQTAAK